MNAWRTGYLIAAGVLALSACAPQKAAAPPMASAPATSYDGIYKGKVELAGLGAGVPAAGCATSPSITLQIQNNGFVYSQAHPNAATTGPASATTTYTVAVAPDGSFSGQSQLSGTMSGTISGTHMSGTIDGLECVYSFSADRL